MRILYLMHVDWRWIKQRPHFLAEELASEHDVRVLFRANPQRLTLPRNPSHVRRYPLVPLPKASGVLLQRRWIAYWLRRHRPHVVWITHPTLYTLLPDLGSAYLVYDCMDDAAAFCTNELAAKQMRQLEHDVCSHSAFVFCSSSALQQDIEARGHSQKTLLVRNAVSGHWLDRGGPTQPVNARRRAGYHLAYVGTIAEWLDVEAILMALRALPKLRMHLIGPLPKKMHAALVHPHITIHGAVSHDALLGLAAEMDAFAMPFRVTALIERVDPVKLYEYMSFGRPIFCVRYQEVERFAPFVHLYSSADEFVELLRLDARGELPAKSDVTARGHFLVANTWSARARDVTRTLESLGQA